MSNNQEKDHSRPKNNLSQDLPLPRPQDFISRISKKFKSETQKDFLKPSSKKNNFKEFLDTEDWKRFCICGKPLEFYPNRNFCGEFNCENSAFFNKIENYNKILFNSENDTSSSSLTDESDTDSSFLFDEDVESTELVGNNSTCSIPNELICLSSSDEEDDLELGENKILSFPSNKETELDKETIPEFLSGIPKLSKDERSDCFGWLFQKKDEITEKINSLLKEKETIENIIRRM